MKAVAGDSEILTVLLEKWFQTGGSRLTRGHIIFRRGRWLSIFKSFLKFEDNITIFTSLSFYFTWLLCGIAFKALPAFTLFCNTVRREHLAYHLQNSNPVPIRGKPFIYFKTIFLRKYKKTKHTTKSNISDKKLINHFRIRKLGKTCINASNCISTDSTENGTFVSQ